MISAGLKRLLRTILNMVAISSDPLLLNRESVGFSMRSQGQKSKLISLDAWQMKNIWDVSLDEWHK